MRGGGERRGVLAPWWPEMTGFRVVSRHGEGKGKICVELAYGVQRTG